MSSFFAPHPSATDYTTSLGSPGSAAHSESRSDLCGKLLISDLIVFKSNVGGF